MPAPFDPKLLKDPLVGTPESMPAPIAPAAFGKASGMPAAPMVPRIPQVPSVGMPQLGFPKSPGVVKPGTDFTTPPPRGWMEPGMYEDQQRTQQQHGPPLPPGDPGRETPRLNEEAVKQAILSKMRLMGGIG